MQPKAGIKFDITAQNDKPKADYFKKDEFRKLHEMTKFTNKETIDKLEKEL